MLGCSKRPHSQSTIDNGLNQAKEGVSANIKYPKYKHTLELFGSAEQKVRGKVKFVVQQLKRFSSHILLLPIDADDHSLTDTFAWAFRDLHGLGLEQIDIKWRLKRRDNESKIRSEQLQQPSWWFIQSWRGSPLCCPENHSKELGMRRCTLWFQKRFFPFPFLFFLPFFLTQILELLKHVSYSAQPLRGISAFDVILGIRSVIHLLYNQMHTHQPDCGF